jgi:N-acetylglucosamine-6-sulfatase
MPSSALRCVLVLLACCLGLAALPAADGPPTTIPEEKDRPKHDGFLTIAKAGNVDLLFMGDSITEQWGGPGRKAWDKYFAPLKAANFGIGGDRTQHVIWRLRHGELEGIQPKVAVLMIGTNNGGDSAEDVALGIKTILKDFAERSPSCRILLLGIFPRSAKADAGDRQKNNQVNKIISGYADNRRVVYLDIGAGFLQPDGTLTTEIMPDLLHLSEKGYQIWADAIIGPVKQMMSEDPSRLIPKFNPPSTVAKVAKQEELIAAGKIGVGTKALEKLAEDKNEKTADAAKVSLAVVSAWKDAIDAELAKAKADGDVFAAAELAATMAANYTPGDIAKGYTEQEKELKKDAAYAAGKEYQKLRAFPYAERRDPRYAKLVEAFVKKYPDGFYATQAKALVPKD